MPVIGIKKKVLEKHFNRVFSEDELDELLFSYGLELDEVTIERCGTERITNDEVGKVSSEEILYKIELPANRYDLLCVEGLTRALRIFLGEINPPLYKLIRPRTKERIIVKPAVSTVRPFVVGAVLRNVKIDLDLYASFIDLQDKLHQNICRKRTLVAIGTHDLDTVKGPFTYNAEKPGDIRFRALNQTNEYSASELMVLYSTDNHLKPYLPIIAGKELYPVIRDSHGFVLSMPPIINGERTKIRLETRNIFIEATATDSEKAEIVLDTVVTMFSQYCKEKFTIEAVDVELADGTVTQYPVLEYRHENVSVESINKRIGLDLSAERMAELLTKMSLVASPFPDNASLEVTIPPTRHDVLHECDIAEDVAIGYGYNSIQQQFPRAFTIAEPFSLNKFSDLLRYDIAAAGWTETLNFALCSRDDITTKVKKPEGLKEAVQIANPKATEFQVARTSLLPGLLKTLSSNRDMSLPLRLFELQDVVVKDDLSDVGARNERRLAAVYTNKSSGFEVIHGFLDRVMLLLGIKWSGDESGYHITFFNDPTYLSGRCAQIVGPKGVILGTLGVLHPDVVSAFELTLPVSAMEINLEPFI